MSSASIASWVAFESSSDSQPTQTQSSRNERTSAEHVSRQRSNLPLDIEMNPLPRGTIKPKATAVQGTAPLSPTPPNEGSQDDRPPAQTSEQMQTIWEPYKNRFRVLASCFMALANGMNDSAPGALLESIEKYDTSTRVQPVPSD